MEWSTPVDHEPPMAHMIYFTLSDTSKELMRHFTDACIKYLSGHKGQSHFSIGYRILSINRDVSATNFEVSVNMIFQDAEAYRNYSLDPRHEEFITQTAGMSPGRTVYDSMIYYSTEAATT